MRTTKARLLGGTLSFCLASGIAAIGVIGTTKTVSLQDIAELSGARTDKDNRWQTHLVKIPTGADYAADKASSTPINENQTTVLGVKTAEGLQTLDSSVVLETGRSPQVNRGLKGDRVVQVKTAGLTYAGIKTLTDKNSIIPSSVGATSQKSPHLMEVARSFRRAMAPIVDVAETTAVTPEELTQTAFTRVALAEEQMNQARAAAKLMNKVLEKTQKREIAVADTIPATASAYAPVASEAETEMASAFVALLRPAVEKKKNRSLIRLAKGDHKWAAKPLPRHSYSKSERRCLANGIYFEARGEPKKGQQAVAQVILNRVKNPAYPNTICGVVYQNKSKRNACQFSFACDGIRDRINSRKHWNKAVSVANAAIDGKFWLRSVGSSSHYHADYVWPKWRRKMRKMTKIGRHIFYRTYGGGWS